MNKYLKPSTLNILGGGQRATHQAIETPPNSAPKPTWKDKIKSYIKRAFGFLKRAFDYTKDVIAPIVVAASGLINAWSNLHRNTESGRSAAWYA